METTTPTHEFRFATPNEALAALLEPTPTVQTESVSWYDAAGRVLARPLLADRDSPPCDVSSMDGYAVRLEDLSQASIPVTQTLRIGQASPVLEKSETMRIVTGGAVPAG